MDGRFAPSPTGALHVGNLRTALVAWLFARSAGSRFLLRFEDLDQERVRREYYDAQRRDLAALGLDWDGEERQTDHRDRYEEAVARLTAAGRTYPCYCTRREIRAAARAPHGELPEGAYPGTCRALSAAERVSRAAARSPALRLRADSAVVQLDDRLRGRHRGVVDDLVLRRGDGTPAYNLAVVVDDAAGGVAEVVRGDDLLVSTPRQLLLADLLGLPRPAHAHVPLVLAPDGSRLAKRHGAVTLDDRRALGETPDVVRDRLAQSIGLRGIGGGIEELLAGFDPTMLHTAPWVFDW